ncbi:hypothetical protein NUU61_009015 [Penicillium alfredii]|uniref:trimethyllysine dioxygenase n=1 Tax=Penicillium alfredii TaxID=1506179 RepID=A0A9W9JWZ5_9EURO|nr:uncharacterized protein NUU61_009015 [Penicillium alfredii]KAJ5084436.1 hypothetical protein NUU61_009015 [Penicillium alfredii]
MGDTFLIDKDVTETEVVHNDKGVEIEWSDGHQSVYSWDWLLPHENRFQRTVNLQRFMERAQRARKFRVVDPIMDPSPTVSYDQVMSENASLLDWLDKIHTFGFCFVEGVPVTPEATKTLIERIAFIRHTHYGGFWDFTADLTYKDTAYTNEFLGPHTDNTYFTDPARLQLFHLLSHTDGEGGENLLVDGFAAADVLLNENPKHHAALMAHKHPWHASGNEDVCIQPVLQAPVIQSHPTYRRVYQIRWNNYDRAPKIDWHIAEQKLWYAAASQFNKIINQPLMQIWTPLKPGTALIFDNWRMLHGRSEFTGKRRMCGGYINNDDYLSRHRLLKFGREKVLNNLGNFWIKKDNPNSIY